MTYLQRINYQPNTDNLSDKERQYLQQHFDAYGAEVVINGERILWQYVEEVEVAVAARAAGPSGWLVRKLVMGGERYHVAVYFGNQEAVLSNVTLEVARYVVKNIAYFAGQPVRYIGPEDLVATTEI